MDPRISFFLFRGRRVANPLGSSAQVCSQLRSFLMNSLFSDLITVPLVFSIFNSFYSFESLSTFFYIFALLLLKVNCFPSFRLKNRHVSSISA